MRKFTKDMLESGKHIVEYRDGERRLYLNGFFIGLYCGLPLSLYNDDLTEEVSVNLDIVKVFLADYKYNALDAILKRPGKLVWERKKPVTISKAEALKKLAEVYGEEVKVEW